MTFLEFYKAQKTPLPIPPASALAGKTYIVTGANVGLGYECAKHLINAKAKRVILAVRSIHKGTSALSTIEQETGNRGIGEVWALDLCSYDSVKAFASKVYAEVERLDGVLENAAMALMEWSTSEGLERSLTVNVVSTMLLGVLLLPKLKQDAQKYGVETHLTMTGSGASFHVPGELEKIGEHENILEALNEQGRFPLGNTRYPVSKLLQLYAMRALATTFPFSQTGVIIDYVNPGLCNTALSRNVTWRQFHLYLAFSAMKAVLGRTPEQGSRTLLHGVTAGKEGHGQYLSECGIQPEKVPEWAKNENAMKIQDKVWKEVSSLLEKAEPGCIERIRMA